MRSSAEAGGDVRYRKRARRAPDSHGKRQKITLIFESGLVLKPRNLVRTASATLTKKKKKKFLRVRG